MTERSLIRVMHVIDHEDLRTAHCRTRVHTDGMNDRGMRRRRAALFAVASTVTLLAIVYVVLFLNRGATSAP